MVDDQLPGGLTADSQTPQERVAATRQLYAVLKEYLDRPTWTPVEGALILSGIHPPKGCTEIPVGGTGLDGRQFANAGNDRFHCAFRIMDEWRLRCDDDEENGEATPADLSPYAFIAWCQDMNIETDWIRLFFDVVGGKSQSCQPDLIPLAVVEYANQVADTIGVIQNALAGNAFGAAPVNAAVQKHMEDAVPPTNFDESDRDNNAVATVYTNLGKKQRRDALDDAIDKAIITVDGSHRTSTVWQALRELALNEERPFTGALGEDGSLVYAKDQYADGKEKAGKFSRNALYLRLRWRLKACGGTDRRS